MDLKFYIPKVATVLFLVAVLPFVKTENDEKTVSADKSFEKLLNRLEILEDREKMRENENKELKNRVLVLESVAKEQQNEMSNLKETIGKQAIVNRQLQDRVLYLENRYKKRDICQSGLKSQQKRIQFLEKFVRRMADKLPTERPNHEDKNESLNNEKRSYEVQRIRNSVNEVNVAFFATLTNHITSPGVQQIIAFDHVITNIGNGYNAHAGDFRAPVAGTYVFATTLMSGNSHLVHHFQIMHNAQPVSNIYIMNGGTSSQEVVLQLNQGDDVSIHNLDAGEKIYGSSYSTFSGFLLQQDYSSTSVIGK